MAAKWKTLIPSKLHDLISLYRTYQRQLRLNQELKAQAVELTMRHIENLKVLPDRKALIELMPKDMVCAEVGVAEGEFSREILDTMRPQRLTLIDLWDADSKRYAKAMEPAMARVQPELEQGIVDIQRGYSWDMLSAMDDNSLDWVYIDAAHDYPFVRKDLNAVLPKMKDRGWICGHDYTRWSSQGIHRWGVVEAVNEFCLEHDWEFRYLTHESHRHISYALQQVQ